jgi:MATE family, multidrug efflux pump
MELEQNAKFNAISKKIWVITIPVFLQAFVEYFLMFTSTVFMGNYQMEGLAAVNNVIYPYFTLISLFYALTLGTTIVIAQSIGAGNLKEAKEYAAVSFFFNQLISLGYFLLWFLLGKNILILVGAKGIVLELGTQYVHILSFTFLGMGFFLTAQAIFQALGKTTPIMISSIVRSLLNVFLNWVLIYGRFGLPEMGVRGAALGTVISEIVSFIIIGIIFSRNRDFTLNFREIAFSKYPLYKQISKIGFPAGIEFILWSCGQSVIIYFLNQRNPLAAGYFGLLVTLMAFVLEIADALSKAAITLVGQAVGEEDFSKAGYIGNISIFYALLICVIIGCIYSFFPGEVLTVFTKDRQVVDKLKSLMFLVSVIIIPDSINIVIGNSIRGTGDTRWMLYTQIGGTLFIIPLAFYFTNILDLGLYGILIALLIDESIRATVNYLRFIRRIKFATAA